MSKESYEKNKIVILNCQLILLGENYTTTRRKLHWNKSMTAKVWVILNKNAKIVLMEVQKKTWFFLFEIYFLGMVIHQSNRKYTMQTLYEIYKK